MKNIYTKNLVTINENALLDEADNLMKEYNIRHLPVVDNADFLVGMLSVSDYLALKKVDPRLDKYDVKTFMSPDVVVINKAASTREVAKKFINKKISSLLIVENELVAGIITTEDLIRFLAEDDSFIALPEKFYSSTIVNLACN